MGGLAALTTSSTRAAWKPRSANTAAPASRRFRRVRRPRARSSRPSPGCRPGTAPVRRVASGPSARVEGDDAHVTFLPGRDTLRRMTPHCRTVVRRPRDRRIPPPLVVEKLTRTMFVRYAGASGDFNPMHHDDTIATPGRQPVGVRPRHALDGTRGAGREGLVRARGDAPAQVRFAKQVWPGDVLTCTAVVTGKREEGGEHLVDLDLTVDEPGRRSGRSPGAADRGGRALTMGLLDGRVAIVTGSGRGHRARVRAVLRA